MAKTTVLARANPRLPWTRSEFLAAFALQPNGCKVWIGNNSRTKDGYGTVKVGGKTWRVHRLVWRLKKGKIPKELEVCHTCDNPPCGNEDHLFLGTHQQNIVDMYNKNRAQRLKGEDHPCSKLTLEQVKEIRSSKMNRTRLAEKFGVSRSLIFKIRSGEIWALSY